MCFWEYNDRLHQLIMNHQNFMNEELNEKLFFSKIEDLELPYWYVCTVRASTLF